MSGDDHGTMSIVPAVFQIIPVVMSVLAVGRRIDVPRFTASGGIAPHGSKADAMAARP